MNKTRDLAMVISGRRVLQAEGKVSAKALRQTHDRYIQGKAKGLQWLEQTHDRYIQGKAKGLQWLEQSEQGRHSLR